MISIEGEEDGKEGKFSFSMIAMVPVLEGI
jgi:hypothetical protein